MFLLGDAVSRARKSAPFAADLIRGLVAVVGGETALLDAPPPLVVAERLLCGGGAAPVREESGGVRAGRGMSSAHSQAGCQPVRTSTLQLLR